MKRFLTALLLVVANFFVMPPVDAEIQTYTGTDEYIVGEHETHEVAKNNSKIRAMRNAQDQAGVFIRSRSRMKDLELVDDEVVTLTEGILKVVGAPIYEIRLLGDGKGILIHTTITVEIDTDDLDRRLSEIARVHGTNKPPIDRPKPLEAPEPEKISPPPPDKTVDNIALSKAKSDEACTLIHNGKADQAIFLCDEAINLNPNSDDAYHARGWAYRNLKEPSKAVSDFKKAIELEPYNAAHYDGLGCVYNDLGEHNKAISVLNHALQLDPNNRYVLEKLGAAYMCLKQYRLAISYCDKSIKINPNDPNYPWAYVTRGKCYQALGEHDKAQADFARARQLGWKG